MTRVQQGLVILAVAAMAAIAGYFASVWSDETDRHQTAQALMDARLEDPEGVLQALSQWRGKVMVVNFWATWCPPCIKEIPELVELQRKFGARGLVIVGIAVDEKPKVIEYMAKVGINYPILIGGLAAVELSRKAGNRLGGLPFTVILDRQANIVSVELGPVHLDQLAATIAAHLPP